MSRKALLAAGLMVSIGIFGGSLMSAQQAPVTVPPGSNPYYLYPVPGVQPVPMLVTPTARFDSPPPTAGISNAGQAGISANSPVGATSTWGPSTVVYTTMQPETVVGAGPAPEASSSGRLINDMGPSYYSDVLPAASTVSLGEVAAQFKASKPAVNARMLTNEDVVYIANSRTGVTLAVNMPPLGPSVAGLVSGQPQSAAQPAPPRTQSSPSANQQGQSGAAGGMAPSESGSQANAGNATTPQVNQNPQSNDAQGKGRLPATSTLLPLLGLLGAVSGGIGLWFRKFRK